MRKSGFLSVLLLILLGWGLYSCLRPYQWNQQVTLTVQTPDGPRSSSTVLRGMLFEKSGFPFPDAGGVSTVIRGEGIVLEVSPARYLFVLLEDMPTPFPVFFPRQAPAEKVASIRFLTETRPIPTDDYPVMVTFEDIANPGTIRAVDPQNLAATFGTGVKLLSLDMQITDAPLTTGEMAKVLPWLAEYSANQWGVNGEGCRYCQAKSGNLVDRIHSSDFIETP